MVKVHLVLCYTCELCDTVLNRKSSEHQYGSEASWHWNIHVKFVKISLLIPTFKTSHQISTWKSNISTWIFFCGQSSGEKHYSCDLCGKVLSHLVISIITSDSIAAKEPYRCDFCGKMYKALGPLRVHIKLSVLYELRHLKSQ